MASTKATTIALLLAGAVTITGCEPVTVAESPNAAARPRFEAQGGVQADPDPQAVRPPPEFIPPRESRPIPPPSRGIPDLDDPALPWELPGPPPRGPIPPGLVSTTVFGRPVAGLDPELISRLREAERLMDGREGRTADDLPGGYGVASISGYRPGSRAHSRGLAVDINYYANPYIMHERGEDELNARLKPVYHRIARLMLGRDSVIPEQITQGTRSDERTTRLFDELREESRAMVTYFRIMRDREAIARHLEVLRKPVISEYLEELLPTGGSVTAEALQRQMMADYVTLSGRAGPSIPGLEYPPPDLSGGDPPFAGDPRYRAPELGFLNMPRELVRALTQVGLRWGAVDLGRSSGDVMHFDLPAPARPTPFRQDRRLDRRE